MFNESSKMLNKFYVNLNIEDISVEEIKKILVMIIFYLNELPFNIWNSQLKENEVKDKILNMLKSLYKLHVFYGNNQQI